MTIAGTGEPDGDALNLGYRAEDLSPDELQQWTVLTERERSVLAKLESPGQRLLIGPRGSGKSTYLKLAYYDALKGQSVLPVYVNYSRSISLEPEFRRNPNALALFRQWLLAQIIAGAAAVLEEIGAVDVSPEDVASLSTAESMVTAIERRRLAEAPVTDFALTPTLQLLERLAKRTGRKRVILLLDDAAHAFSSEQQREFFEVFGALKSRNVSAKAAVYPGVTSYTPRFHVGHDAQLVDVWLRPDDADYLQMMREVAQRRVSAEDFDKLLRREGVLDYLALASFGLPRTFILLVSQVLEASDERRLTASKTLSDAAIGEAADTALKVFESLQDKLPRYRNFVAVGRELVDRSVDAIREYNERRSEAAAPRATTILLQRPLAPEVERVLGFLEYAGVFRRTASVSMGDESYEVVIPHYALLLSGNALALGRNPSVAVATEALAQRDPHARVRRQVESLLGKDYLSRCRLDLASCPACGAQRENAEARFCFNCGARLEEASLYDELLSVSVDKLPLTDAMLKRIADHSDIRQVKDVLMDEERQALLKIPYVGRVRATRIRGLAEEFVYE